MEYFNKKLAGILAGSKKVATFASAFKENGGSYRGRKFAIKGLKPIQNTYFSKNAKFLKKDLQD